MRRFFRTIRPKSFTEGFLVVLSLVLVVATTVMVIGYKNPIDASPDTEIRLEAHATENFQTPAESQKDEAILSKIVQNNILPRTGKTKRQFAELANNLGVLTSEVLSQPLSELRDLLGLDLGAKLENNEQEAPVDFAVGGLEIGLQDEAPLPPAVQEEVPTEAPTNPPIYAPTAPPAPSQEQNTSPAYAPTAPPSPEGVPTSPAPAPSIVMPTQASEAPTSPQENSYAPAPPAGNNPAGDNPGGNNPSSNASPQDVATAEAGVLALINEYRAASGLRTLSSNGTIKGICNTRAAEISSFYHSGHLRADGSFALNWITNNWGSQYAQGENIGYLSGIHRLNANTIFNAFYNSGKGHREIMMNPNISIGAVSLYVSTDQNRIYVCMNFGH